MASMPSPRVLVAALAVMTFLVSACGGASTPEPTPTPPFGLPPLALPRDEAPHDFQTEWWYFNLHLTADEGLHLTADEGLHLAGDGEAGDGAGPWALHFVVFQVQELESSRTLYVAQVGLADGSAGTHAQAERLRAEAGPLKGTDGGFDLSLGAWLMSGEEGSYRLRADAGGTTFDVTLEAVGPALLHEGDGLVDFGRAGVSYYYSRPRLIARGTVGSAEGRLVPVSGLGWLDKQWGNFQPVAVGWDWASIQLDDGTALMLSNLVDAGGGTIRRYGTLLRSDGSVAALGADDFSLEGGPRRWTSEETGGVYPLDWAVRVPGEDIELTLVPLVGGSEFASRALGVVYWESGMEVRDAAGAQVGQGFVELTGRAGLRAAP